MLMMAPRPRARIEGTTRRLARTAGHRFKSMARCQSSSLVSWNELPVDPPTLLTRMSIAPKATLAASTASRTPCAIVTSATTAIA
jgi:hypothetical protein